MATVFNFEFDFFGRKKPVSPTEEELAEAAVQEGIAKIAAAKSRFREALGDAEIDAAILGVDEAEAHLKAALTRAGNRFTRTKSLELRRFLSAGGRKLRPEYRVGKIG